MRFASIKGLDEGSGLLFVYLFILGCAGSSLLPGLLLAVASRVADHKL